MILAFIIFIAAQVITPPVVDQSAPVLEKGTYTRDVLYSSAPVTVTADKDRLGIVLDGTAFTDPKTTVEVNIFTSPDGGVTLIWLCGGITRGSPNGFSSVMDCPDPNKGKDRQVVTTLLSKGGNVNTGADISVANSADVVPVNPVDPVITP
jgi:hypothetical protein